MKIRNGFVTNSSSSSYIMVGRRIEFEDITMEKEVWGLGKYMDDGRDVFMLTAPMKETLLKIKREMIDCELEFWEVLGISFDNGEICMKCIPEGTDLSKLYAIGEICDQNSTNSVDELIKEYVTWTEELFNK